MNIIIQNSESFEKSLGRITLGIMTKRILHDRAGYEIYLQSFFNTDEKMNFASPNDHVIYSELYKILTSNDGFDDFPKISDHFPKISECFAKSIPTPDECFRRFSKITNVFRRLRRRYEDSTTMDLQLEGQKILSKMTWSGYRFSQFATTQYITNVYIVNRGLPLLHISASLHFCCRDVVFLL